MTDALTGTPQKDPMHTPRPHTAYEILDRIDTPRLYLRPMRPEDTEAVVAWRSEPGTARMLVQPPPTRAEHEAWFLSPRLDRIDYVIVNRATDVAIGVVNYKSLNAAQRSAETGTLIGDPGHRRQGYAREAKVAWMLYGFADLGLDEVNVHIRADNTRMIEIDAALGYVRVDEVLWDTAVERGVRFVRMRLSASTALVHPDYLGADPHGFRAKLAERLGGRTGER